jgi:hypothetical protein
LGYVPGLQGVSTTLGLFSDGYNTYLDAEEGKDWKTSLLLRTTSNVFSAGASHSLDKLIPTKVDEPIDFGDYFKSVSNGSIGENTGESAEKVISPE